MASGETSLGRERLLAPASGNFVRLAHLRKLRGTEQVAAVCYRVRDGKVEFLLVETDGGRWTFPKGNIESGLTPAQSAALEAFEEAGVHGRIEEASFGRYVRRKGRGPSRQVEVTVGAHLCEVSWTEKPQEQGRNPSWFSPEKAKKRLREKRKADDTAEHCRILDLALLRIAR